MSDASSDFIATGRRKTAVARVRMAPGSGKLTINGREFDNYFQGVATDIPTFSAADILFVHRFFHKIMRLYATGQNWPTPVRRPADSRLDCTRLHQVFGVRMPHWEDALDRTVAAIFARGA